MTQPPPGAADRPRRPTMRRRDGTRRARAARAGQVLFASGHRGRQPLRDRARPHDADAADAESRGREEDVLIEEREAGQTLGWSALIPPHRFTLKATAPLDTDVLALPAGGAARALLRAPRRRVRGDAERRRRRSASGCRSSRRCGCARCSAWRSKLTYAERHDRRGGWSPACARAGLPRRARRWPTRAAGGRPRRPQLPGRPAAGAERPEVPPPPFTDGHLPVLHLPRQTAGRTARGGRSPTCTTDIVLQARRGASLVPRLPRRGQPRQAPPGQRRAACRSRSRTGCAGSATARSTATGAPACTAAAAGSWNGHKQYLLCAHCHNPHQPHFQPIAPKPAPTAAAAADEEHGMRPRTSSRRA